MSTVREREKAWADLEDAVRRVLQCERMRRLKADYSVYDDLLDADDLEGTVEMLASPKKITRKSVAAHGGVIR